MVQKIKPIVGGLVGFVLCFGSTVASAATNPASSAIYAPMSISPFVALSAYGTIQSRSAVCAAAAGAAGASAVVQEQARPQGCVLPLLDPAAAAAVKAAPLAYAASAPSGFGFGIGALLTGLVLVAGLAAVLLTRDGDGRFPISPD